jgi:hypothetical protein
LKKEEINLSIEGYFMKCKNCKTMIPDDAETCPECGIYVKQLKVNDDSGLLNAGHNDMTEEIELKDEGSGFFLKLDGGTRFGIPVGREITIGRKDVAANPDIDLGPFDNGPYISRNQGIFFLEDEVLYFTDTSKNGTLLNNKIMQQNVRTKLKNKDELQFGNIRGVIETV